MKAVSIIDYGTGNLHSIVKKFRRIGAEPVVVSTAADLKRAEHLVLPGVGHFGHTMRNLEASGLRAALDDAVLGRGIPALGICLGMQLFGRHSEEGDSPGLGWLDADVVRFKIKDTVRFKVPQMGWNSMETRRESPLTRGLPTDSEFYFAHAYHLVCHDASDVLGDTGYEYAFPGAVQRRNIYGVQFHPEKSHDVGEVILRNFVSL